jgi:hypothetical protein
MNVMLCRLTSLGRLNADEHKRSDDDDARPPERSLDIVPRIEPLSIVQRIGQLLTEASLDEHGEAIMAVDVRQPGYAAQLVAWLNAQLARRV